MAPPETPITLPDYPNPGDRASVYFGAAPDFVLEAYVNRRAIGMLFLQGLARSPECQGMTPIQVVDHFRADPQLHLHATNFMWFTTLVIERSVDVDDENVVDDRPHYWLQPATVTALESDFEDQTRTHLDRLASAVAAVVRPGLLTEVVVSAVYFFASDKAPFGHPKLQGSGTASVIIQMDQFPLAELRTSLQELANSAEPALRALDSVRHWYLEGRKEKDRWKRFLWSFLALEIMVRKLSKQLLPEVVGRFRLDGEIGRGTELLASLVPEHQRLPLTAQFVVMALGLSPTTGRVDLLTFKSIKKVRDRLSHGDVRSAEELPLGDTESLLQRYFSLAMSRNLILEA